MQEERKGGREGGGGKDGSSRHMSRGKHSFRCLVLHNLNIVLFTIVNLYFIV